MSFEDEYFCNWCKKPFDIEKTKIDILLRKFDINEALVKASQKIDKLEKQLEEAESVLSRIHDEDRTKGELWRDNELIKEYSEPNTSARHAEEYFKSKESNEDQARFKR